MSYVVSDIVFISHLFFFSVAETAANGGTGLGTALHDICEEEPTEATRIAHR